MKCRYAHLTTLLKLRSRMPSLNITAFAISAALGGLVCRGQWVLEAAVISVGNAEAKYRNFAAKSFGYGAVTLKLPRYVCREWP